MNENDPPPLPWILASAPLDDEPLTPEEVAILDARRASAVTGRTIPDAEVGRMLDAHTNRAVD